MNTFTLPHLDWKPRHYQIKLWNYLSTGGKRAVNVWHRRAGKDEIALHWAACSMVRRAGNYWHMLPEASQARKAIWEAVNPHSGIRRIDEAFPLGLFERRETDMLIRSKVNKSTWQVVGSDNFNSLLGSPPIGIVFSEYSISNPSSWAYLAPILEENGGWAIFIFTARGRNHGYNLIEMARKQAPKWYAEVLPATETGVFTRTQLESIQSDYVDQWGQEVGSNLFEQEYLCSFDAAIMGAYYGRELALLERDGRVTDSTIHDGQSVNTAWDLGIGDSTAIWWWIHSGSEIRVLDYYENHGFGFEHYAEICKNKEYEHGWLHGLDYVPHDAKVRELGTGRTRVETLIGLGRKPRLVADHKVEDRINSTRQSLKRVWFHPRCAKGIELLKQYRADWDDKNRCFRDAPKHDASSHCADSFGYLCMAWKELVVEPIKPPTKVVAVGAGNEITLNDAWDAYSQPRRRI